jgi:hypothetical protein
MKNEILANIRMKSKLLAPLNDESLTYLYHKWTEDFNPELWNMNQDVMIDIFIKWATTAPYEIVANAPQTRL